MREQWQTTRSRVFARRDQFIAEHGPCENCGTTEGLTVSWRSRENRPVHSMWHLWNRSESSRAEWVKLLIVLCRECMRAHRSGVVHGGGVKGVRGCKCLPCRTQYREYFNGRMRELRERRKAR